MPRYDGLITPHKPGGAIAKYRLVKHGSADGTVVQATDDKAAIIGVSTRVAAASTDPTTEVVRSGVADVEYGAGVARGDPLTANGDGKAIKASGAANKTRAIVGFAEVAGAAGDIGSVMIAPAFIRDAVDLT